MSRSLDNKCQAKDCDAQAVQRGTVSGLFLCHKCRNYERIHRFSINGAERAAYLQEKEQKVDTRPKDGLCEATHCETKHGKRGSVSKLYLCNSCMAYEYTRKRSVNSNDGIKWQVQRNEKSRSKLDHWFSSLVSSHTHHWFSSLASSHTHHWFNSLISLLTIDSVLWLSLTMTIDSFL